MIGWCTGAHCTVCTVRTSERVKDFGLYYFAPFSKSLFIYLGFELTILDLEKKNLYFSCLIILIYYLLFLISGEGCRAP